jgi:hypothetical protein
MAERAWETGNEAYFGSTFVTVIDTMTVAGVPAARVTVQRASDGKVATTNPDQLSPANR